MLLAVWAGTAVPAVRRVVEKSVAGNAPTDRDDILAEERADASFLNPLDVKPQAWAVASDESNNKLDEQDSPFRKTSLLQPQPPLLPQQEIQPETPLPSVAESFAARIFGPGGTNISLLSQRRQRLAAAPSSDIVFGSQAMILSTTDTGNLLGKAPEALGIGIQRRTPIVNDPRIRGSRIGQLAASGSYWVPARIDLDTMLSKIDSRIINNVIVVKGPYSAFYGPGLHFLDVELLRTPRYDNGHQLEGSTSIDYKTNGEQWYGRQALWGGDQHWGYRVGYGHRTGSDYTSGNGMEVPSAYRSRDLDVALGADPTPDSNLEFNYLRLDQTDVLFPGQAFDMTFLVTDGYEVSYVLEDQPEFDRMSLDVWYNRTHFEGNTQNPGKREQFPFFDFINFVGFTDADVMSLGYRVAFTWGQDGDQQVRAGADLRYVEQELNELSSGIIGFIVWDGANSPIPKSKTANPGFFIDHNLPLTERWTITSGARADIVSANIVENQADLQDLGILGLPLASILGTDDFDQEHGLWSAFARSKYEVDDETNLYASVGLGQRPPSLTEMYVAQSFLFLLANGVNTATGDPRLHPEEALQMDFGLTYDNGRFRYGLNGFHSWVHNYITFEALSVFTGPPAGQVEQLNLKYVNTDLATFVGADIFGEYDLNPWLTAFATMQYVEGRDQTRNGLFATEPASPSDPSQRVYGLPRGSFSGILGGAEEPLPSIAPLESRAGIRLHEPCEQPTWGVEFTARIVDDQDRVATSLLESTTPGFTVYDIRSYWQVNDCWLLVAGVENFTDKNYREYLDFRSPSGRQLFQPGINFTFGSELKY